MSTLLDSTRSSTANAYFDESMVNQVLYFAETDAVLWISQDHAYQPHVRVVKQRLESRFAGRPFKVAYASMEVVDEKDSTAARMPAS